MRLLRPSEFKSSPGQVVFRQSRLLGTIRMVGLGGIFIAAGPVARLAGAPWFVWVPCLAVALLPILIFPGSIAALYRKSNWILATDRNAVWINLRSHLNYRLAEGQTVVQIEMSEIGGVSLHSEKYSTPSPDGGSTTWATESIELRLTRPDMAELVESLEQERNREPVARKFLWSSRVHHYPVSVPERGTIRIAWRGSTMEDHVTPSAGQAIRLLVAAGVSAQGPALTKRGDWRQLDGPELDSLVTKLALSGSTLEAVELLRERRGLTLTGARRQVERITAGSMIERAPSNYK